MVQWDSTKLKGFAAGLVRWRARYSRPAPVSSACFLARRKAALLSAVCDTPVAERNKETFISDLPALERNLKSVDGRRSSKPEHMRAGLVVTRDDREALRTHAAEGVTRGISARDGHPGKAVSRDELQRDLPKCRADPSGDLRGVKPHAAGDFPNSRRVLVLGP